MKPAEAHHLFSLQSSCLPADRLQSSPDAPDQEPHSQKKKARNRACFYQMTTMLAEKNLHGGKAIFSTREALSGNSTAPHRLCKHILITFPTRGL